jgi:hypothetical protein
MFRTAVMSIVLMLAAGQNTGMLCDAWCHRVAHMTGACDHLTETPAAGVVAGDDCAVSGTPIVFVREDARHSSGEQHVKAASADTPFAIPARALRAVPFDASHDGVFEWRPLAFALRI